MNTVSRQSNAPSRSFSHVSGSSSRVDMSKVQKMRLIQLASLSLFINQSGHGAVGAARRCVTFESFTSWMPVTLKALFPSRHPDRAGAWVPRCPRAFHPEPSDCKPLKLTTHERPTSDERLMHRGPWSSFCWMYQSFARQSKRPCTEFIPAKARFLFPPGLFWTHQCKGQCNKKQHYVTLYLLPIAGGWDSTTVCNSQGLTLATHIGILRSVQHNIQITGSY